MRGMKRVRAYGFGLGLLTAIASAPAVAAEIGASPVPFSRNQISVTLKAQPYPFPKNGYGAYEFAITNTSSGSFSNARFRASLPEGGEFVVGGTPVQADRATCTFLSPTEVDCIIGTGDLPAAGTTSFNFQVKTPSSGTQIKLVWSVRNGVGDAVYLDDPDGFSTTPLSQEDTTGPIAKISTAIPPEGYYVYTGTGADNQPAPKDHASAARVSPKTGTLIITSIAEGVATGTAAGLVYSGTCDDPDLALGAPNRKYCSKLSVETGDGQKAHFDSFNAANSTLSEKLTIVFRIAAQDVVGLNINDARIYYIPDGGGTPGYLPPCNKRSSSYVPVDGNDPCIASRTVLSKKFGPALSGAWELVIFAKSNGRFGIERCTRHRSRLQPVKQKKDQAEGRLSSSAFFLLVPRRRHSPSPCTTE